MLLRRMTQHVKDQNWFAVGLDFAIVVLGVFIGVQMSNWNDTRLDRAAEITLLKSLEEDFREIANAVEDTETENAQFAAETGHLIELLRSEEVPPAIPDLERYINAPTMLSDLPNQSATYSEMISTGGLASIRDVKLRRALSSLGQNSKQFEQYYGRLLTIQSAASEAPEILDAIRLSTNPDAVGNAAIASYDWDALRQAEPQLQAIYIFQQGLAHYAGYHLEEVHAILDLLEEERRE
jgi:hypothetical protein